jgi:exoribonuclease R
MFPSILAEEVFSLTQGHMCPTLTFIATVAADGTLLKGDIQIGRAQAQRITYDDADKIISGADEELQICEEARAQLKVCG